ncbi:hypothetical protein [Streptomyces sp. NPDC093970]|uniref:hypothetical protein n=1 Tax=Streptomyces sp. NPDC093970 TaxID=3155076 RepID=UPI00341F984C
MGDENRRPEPEPAPSADAPWWAGIGLPGGVVLVVCGSALLLWLVVGGGATWSSRYGAAKVLAVGTVVTGTALLARRRERD